MDMSATLAAMRDADQKKFLTIRNSMRKTYLMAIQATVGITNYAPEDDTFMDAIDLKCEMLATRAGMATLDNDNLHADENAVDPFAIITRPAAKSELEVDQSKIESKITPMPDAPAWGKVA